MQKYSVSQLDGLAKGRAAKKAIQLASRATYMENPATCGQCNLILPYRQRHNKFCGASCSAKAANVQCRSKRTCLKCGLQTNNKKYCGTECKYSHQRVLRKEIITINAKLVDSKKDKWYLIETRGHRCEQCGLEKWLSSPVPLVLDHIDGNSDDDSLINVRLLCHNCNALTPTFCGRNKGKGRHTKRASYRNSRYAAGKSY
jgi:hypothetical protein